MERTLALLKPEVFRDDKLGFILEKIVKIGLAMKHVKMVMPSRALVEAHYQEHRGKPFYDNLVSQLADRRVVVMILEGENAIQRWRELMGTYVEAERQAGTIRGDLMQPGQLLRENYTHGSDSPESAKREIALWYEYDKICCK